MAGDDPLLLLIAADQRVDILDALSRFRDVPPAQLPAAVRAAGVPVEDLEIGRADLEDVFLEIMQGPAT